MSKKEYLYQVSIDKLEITYTTNENVKEYLSTGNNLYSFHNGNLWLQRDEPRYYQNEFIIWCKDWNDEKGYFTTVYTLDVSCTKVDSSEKKVVKCQLREEESIKGGYICSKRVTTGKEALL